VAWKAPFVAVLLPVFCASWAAPASAQGRPKPKVRTITAFVRLDPAQYAPQVTEALEVLRGAKREFESQGYEIESLRIVTQPLGELVKGQSVRSSAAVVGKLEDEHGGIDALAVLGLNSDLPQQRGVRQSRPRDRVFGHSSHRTMLTTSRSSVRTVTFYELAAE